MLTLVAAIATVLAITYPINARQSQPLPRTNVDNHLHDIAQQLPANSGLRREILEGARGTGVRYAWMDELKKNGTKRVVVWVDITFDNRGRPRQSNVNRTEYFSRYDGGSPISDPARLKAIRDSGLEVQLDKFALGRAARGRSLDVPRPRPSPFVGGVKIELFDDPRIPAPGPMYFAAPRNGSNGR